MGINNRIQFGRNPFARETIRKRKVPGSCSFCGQHDTKGRTWEFYVERDEGPRNDGPIGTACGIECLNAYNGT